MERVTKALLKARSCLVTYVDDIADDEIVDFDTSELALPEDKALRGDQVLESFHDFGGF